MPLKYKTRSKTHYMHPKVQISSKTQIIPSNLTFSQNAGNFLQYFCRVFRFSRISATLTFGFQCFFCNSFEGRFLCENERKVFYTIVIILFNRVYLLFHFFMKMIDRKSFCKVSQFHRVSIL